MLRSAGFAIAAHPEEEVYFCRRVARSGATTVSTVPRGAVR
jgi:tRNA (mo5U34)-methyltransferase